MDLTEFGAYLNRQNILTFIQLMGLSDAEIVEAVRDYKIRKEENNITRAEEAKQVAFAFRALELDKT